MSRRYCYCLLQPNTFGAVLIAQEIVDDLEAALEEFHLIAKDLGSDASEKVT